MKESTVNYQIHRSKIKSQGFTLIELIVVMTIIISLAAIGFGVFSKMYESGKEKETKLILEAVSTAMIARAADISSVQRAEATLDITAGLTFPNGDNTASSTAKLILYISGDFNGDGNIDVGAETKLTQVLEESGEKESFIKQVGTNWVIVDAWETPIRYQFPGVYHTEDDGFDLESAGPDKEFGSDSNDPLAKDNIILK